MDEDSEDSDFVCQAQDACTDALHDEEEEEYDDDE
jgi:hypothetical protein